MSVKYWLQAARPKTLAAAAAPVIIVCTLAFRADCFSFLPALAILTCALLIQIATNFANDVVDYQRGVDTEERLGPRRLVQAGLISTTAMWRATFFTLSLALLIGCYLVYIGGTLILLIGVSALFFALLYSATKWALSYRGIAEPFVFLYFGPIATIGTEHILCAQISGTSFIAGCCTGMLSSAILAVNNLRDIDSDRSNNKKTLAVRFGERFARVEIFVLLLVPAIFVGLLNYFGLENKATLFSLFYLAPAMVVIRLVAGGTRGEELNRLLTYCAKSLIVFAILFSIGLIS